MNFVVTHEVGLNLSCIKPNHRDLAQSLPFDRDGRSIRAGCKLTGLKAADRGRLGPVLELVSALVVRLEQGVEDLTELERGFVGEHAHKGADSIDTKRIDDLLVSRRAREKTAAQHGVENKRYRHTDEGPTHVPPKPAATHLAIADIRRS